MTLSFLFSSAAYSQQDAADLAKQLANPIASLISLPLQSNVDMGIGPFEGSRYTLNIQPVIPISITEDLNLITRAILPVINQYSIIGPGDKQSGLGDMLVTAFVSPKDPKIGLIWGAGPAILIPTGTRDIFSSNRLGLGPSIVVLKQTGALTYGTLLNQVWTFGDNEEHPSVSQFYFQPFIVYNWSTGGGVGTNFEITQNWTADNTIVWMNPFVNGLTSIGKQKLQLGIGPRFNFAAPESGKASWGIRATIVLLFPK